MGASMPEVTALPEDVTMFEGLFQPMHLLLILGICLLFFGPGKLPELGRGLGTSIREFRKAFQNPEEPPKDPPQIGSGDDPNKDKQDKPA